MQEVFLKMYETIRKIEKEINHVKMGFDYLPTNYEFLDRRAQNNAYMVSMWEQEQDEFNKVISTFSEFQYLGGYNDDN